MGALFSSPPATAPNVDLVRYTGFDTPAKQRLWCCIYAFPHIWMPKSHHTVRALYKWDNDAKEMRLRNTSLEGPTDSPRVHTIFGSAWVDPNYQTNAKLLVEFDFARYLLGIGINIVPNIAPAHYWILMVADDYRYAVVSSPCRSSLFILSSTPQFARADLEVILYKLKMEHGFTVHQLRRLYKYELPTEGEEQAQEIEVSE